MPYMQATMNEFHRRASIGELLSYIWGFNQERILKLQKKAM